VTIDGETRHLPRPFLVVATQNPIELEGTFPLPEAQIDRFLIKLPLGYPSAEEEESILLRFHAGSPLDDLKAVTTREELIALRQAVQSIRIEESVRRYIVALVRATRDHQEVELGASPRGTLGLYHAAQALAAIRSRAFVLPDDVKHLVPYVLTHRIMLSPQMRLRGRRPEDIVAGVIEDVPVPVEG
jgi:MoxR-like ATPase